MFSRTTLFDDKAFTAHQSALSQEDTGTWRRKDADCLKRLMPRVWNVRSHIPQPRRRSKILCCSLQPTFNPRLNLFPASPRPVRLPLSLSLNPALTRYTH